MAVSYHIFTRVTISSLKTLKGYPSVTGRIRLMDLPGIRISFF